ncbi:hypothetical protein SAMN05443429_11234 [Cruoricaptor ignavus]|uniref:Uncharacterized protein n=1 Tax=Cruoricaptor ignavus TaxID=1118202 RepID=A0A1M6HE92_9FLAO|nr:hypothetical protein [Cruoricaptor ignavus]SHJ20527.1 hypothetical protein SAMN05443429_11234 [Cruoricaptor ignavus]
MTISGLENNYYLCGNDIWLTVSGVAEIVYLKVKNLDTEKELHFKFQPSLNNIVEFNISQAVRALMDNGRMRRFEFEFRNRGGVKIFTKNFLLGHRRKDGNREWFLRDGQELIVGKWIKFSGTDIVFPAQRIKGNEIIDFFPEPDMFISNHCSAAVLRFRNSLAGWQYYSFDRYEVKKKTEERKPVETMRKRLRFDNFTIPEYRTEPERTITLFSRTPMQAQEVIADLIESPEVYLYNPNGADDQAMWQRLLPLDNEVIENNWDFVYENKLEYQIIS